MTFSSQYLLQVAPKMIALGNADGIAVSEDFQGDKLG